MSFEENDKAPLFKSWNTWYTLVIIVLVVLMGLFYLLTEYFG